MYAINTIKILPQQNPDFETLNSCLIWNFKQLFKQHSPLHSIFKSLWSKVIIVSDFEINAAFEIMPQER